LREPVSRGRDPGSDLARDRGGECQFRPRRDHQEIHADRAAAHARGRRADADHEAEAQFREQALRRRDRCDVRRAGGGLMAGRTREGLPKMAKDVFRAPPSPNMGQSGKRRLQMSKTLTAFGLAIGALALTQLPAIARTKVTNEGISANEIVIGTHQDLSGPIKGWGVPVSNGMKMAVEEVNTAGGINGRKIKLIVEDTGYDPKRAVLASQRMIERDKIFAMVGPMGSPTVLAAQDV